MKKLTLLLALISCFQFAFAQSYNTAGGIRLGSDWGLTVQQRVAKRTTIEGILQAGGKSDLTSLTLMGEQHMPVITKRLNIYFGGGLHKGWYNNSDITFDDPFGLAFVGGAEFTLGRINLSWDLKPTVNLSGGEKSFYTQSGISVRYVMVKRKMELFDKKAKSKRKKQRQKSKNKKDKKPFNWKIWE